MSEQVAPKPPIELAREMLAGFENMTPGQREAERCSEPNIEALIASYLEMVEALEKIQNELEYLPAVIDLDPFTTIISKALATARGEQ